MWEGQGWQRTQRQLGVAAFLICLVAELVFDPNIPVAVYSGIFAMLGLDLLVEALGQIGQARDKDRGKEQ